MRTWSALVAVGTSFGMWLGLGATASGDDEPVYLDRLQLPIPDDRFGFAESVTADLHTGEVFVCDKRDSRILIFDSEGLFTFQIDGSGVFSTPRDIAVDPEGFLILLATRGSRSGAILELDFDGRFRREIALSGIPDGIEKPYLVSLALSPKGDRIYTLDQRNLMIWIADREGKILFSVDLAPELSEEQRIDVILRHIDVYADRILVPIPMFGEVRIYDLDGNPSGRAGQKGVAQCLMAFPTAAAVDSTGHFVVIDQQRMVMQRWSPDGKTCLGDFYSIGNRPGYFYYPADLALDSQGRVYVSQGWDGRVQIYEGLPPAAGSPSAADQEVTERQPQQ